MHEFLTIPIANMTYTRLHNYANMVGGEHGIHTFQVMVDMLLLWMLLFDVLVPKSAHPLLFLDKWFVQIYFNVSYMLWFKYPSPIDTHLKKNSQHSTKSRSMITCDCYNRVIKQ